PVPIPARGRVRVGAEYGPDRRLFSKEREGGRGAQHSDLVLRLRSVFRLVGDLLQFLVRAFEGLLEIADPLAERAADLGEFAGAEDDQRNDQNNDELGDTDTEHGVSSVCSLITPAPAAKPHSRPPSWERDLSPLPARAVGSRSDHRERHGG